MSPLPDRWLYLNCTLNCTCFVFHSLDFPPVWFLWLLSGPCSACCHLGHYKHFDWLIDRLRACTFWIIWSNVKICSQHELPLLKPACSHWPICQLTNWTTNWPHKSAQQIFCQPTNQLDGCAVQCSAVQCGAVFDLVHTKLYAQRLRANWLADCPPTFWVGRQNLVRPTCPINSGKSTKNVVGWHKEGGRQLLLGSVL